MSGQGPIPSRKPRVRRLSVRSIVLTTGGREKAYPVYRFSGGRARYEKPGHNPFSGL